MSEALTESIRFLVADDNEAVLESYRLVMADSSTRPGLDSEVATPEVSISEGERQTASRTPPEVVLCHQGDEAIEAVRASVERGEPFAAAFIDVRMPPGPDGVWTAQRIRELDPYVHIVIVTAYSDFDPEDIARRVPPSDRLLYLEKPFHATEIRRFLWALSTKWCAARASRQTQAELERLNEELKRGIEAHQRVEEALQKSEEQFRTLFNSAVDAIFLADPQTGRLVEVNQAAETLTGYSRQALLQMHQSQLHPPDKVEHYKQMFARHIGQRHVADFEAEVSRKDGSTVPVYISATVTDLGGRQIIQGRFVDITERKQAEEALVQAARQWQETFDAINDLVIMIDSDYRIVRANAAMRQLFPDQQIISAHCYELLHGSTARLPGCPACEAFVTGESIHLEIQEPHLDDGWFALYAYPVKDEEGTVTEIVHVIRDITEHKQAEEERRLLEEQLFQAQKLEAVGTLAGGVAHDFNNLLTGIIGMTELALKHLDPDSKAYEYLAYVPEQGKRAAELIASLMTFSRHTESELRPLTLLPLVKETGRILRRTLPENIEMRVRWPERVPLVNADPTQIQQIIMNLVTNARDAMPDGGELTIELAEATLDEQYCHHYADATPGDYVCLSVRDMGGGMTPEVQEHIFEPFFTTKDMGEGTGLGLPMVYGIVKNHEGHVHVYSEVGKGTEFKVYLPVSNDQVIDKEAGIQEDAPHGTEALLLVEDDPTVLAVGQGMLESLGYIVLTATNGEEGLEVYRAYRDDIALVLTDMTMPRMGGHELYRAVSQIDPEVKVLLISGYSCKEEVAALQKQGLRAFVQKPFDLQALAQVVRSTLDTDGSKCTHPESYRVSA